MGYGKLMMYCWIIINAIVWIAAIVIVIRGNILNKRNHGDRATHKTN